MKSLSVVTISRETIDAYSAALETYYSSLIEETRGKNVVGTETIKQRMQDFLNRISSSQSHLFTQMDYNDGDRFRADIYNSTMRDLYLDTLMLYRKIVTLENTINNVIKTEMMLRRIIINKIEEAFVKLDLLRYILDNNVLFDSIHIINNESNKNPDVNTSVNLINNTAYLKVLDRTGIPTQYLMNDISVIPFNTNINLHINQQNVDTQPMIDIYGVSAISQPKVDTFLAQRFSINPEDISHGFVIGINITMNQPTKINMINLQTMAGYPIEIYGVYFTTESYQHTNVAPIHIAHYTNQYNIDDITIFLENTIEAKNIIVVVKQLYFEHSYLPDNLMNYTEIANNIINTSNTYTVNKINTLSTKLSRKVQSIIDKVKSIFNTNRPQPKQYIYNIPITGVSVEYNRYDDANTYMTEMLSEDKNINYLSIIESNNYTDSANIIKYSVRLLDNTQYNIIPYTSEYYDQIIEVLDPDIKTYKLDLLGDLNNSQFQVYRNGTVYTDYTLHSLYNDIVYEVEITGNIDKNDIFNIKYIPSDHDAMARHLNYKRLSIKDIYRPSLKNKQCTNNKQPNRVLVKYDDGIRTHIIGDTIHMAQIPFSDGIKPGWLIPNPIGDLPSGGIDMNGQFGIPIEATIPQQTTIYYGILDEEIKVAADLNSDTGFETQYEYVPGSLFVWWLDKNILLKIDEYDVETDSSTIINKKQFTLKIDGFVIPAGAILLLQYTPISFSNGISNINTYNMIESFNETDEMNQIRLQHIPYIDNDIVNRSLQTYNDWIYANGMFVYKYNQTTIYNPISVNIDGVLATNKTSFEPNKQSVLGKFISQLKNYEYVLDGYTIKFNTKIEDKNIKVSYYVNGNEYNIKATLYRTNRTTDTTTPLLNPFGVIVTYDN